jgi:MFS transporter, FSR family, fosmidomycin resistance protein
MVFPAGASLLLIFLSWRQAVFIVGAGGVVAGVAVLLMLSSPQRCLASQLEAQQPEYSDAPPGWAPGFGSLLSIGMADSATRMGLMTFLPFVLLSKGASPTMIGLALTLTFAGGAFGKLACGFLSGRLGVTRTIVATKAITAALIIAVPLLPPAAILAILPGLGTMVNGTSSAIYGSVPEFRALEQRSRAFGIFYTTTIGSAAGAPVAFGALYDAIGLSPMMVGIAGTALLTLMLAIVLRRLARHQHGGII